jgi:hypothetical protein
MVVDVNSNVDVRVGQKRHAVLGSAAKWARNVGKKDGMNTSAVWVGRSPRLAEGKLPKEEDDKRA